MQVTPSVAELRTIERDLLREVDRFQRMHRHPTANADPGWASSTAAMCIESMCDLWPESPLAFAVADELTAPLDTLEQAAVAFDRAAARIASVLVHGDSEITHGRFIRLDNVTHACAGVPECTVITANSAMIVWTTSDNQEGRCSVACAACGLHVVSLMTAAAVRKAGSYGTHRGEMPTHGHGRWTKRDHFEAKLLLSDLGVFNDRLFDRLDGWAAQ